MKRTMSLTATANSARGRRPTRRCTLTGGSVAALPLAFAAERQYRSTDTAMIDLEALSSELPRRLDQASSVHVVQRGPEAGKLVLTIEAAAFVASVSIWENGCCDFDFVTLATKQDLSWHYEF